VRIPRIYCPKAQISQHSIELDSKTSSYLCKVLRLTQADAVLVFDGEGRSYSSRLSTVSAKNAILTISEIILERTESNLQLHLGLGMSKGDRMDMAIQKAVEVGITQITPLTTKFSVIHLDKKRQQKKIQHWQGIIIHACEQSGRTHVPKINPISPLAHWLTHEADQKIVFDPEATQTLSQLTRPNTVSLLIGPEGGLDSAEIILAKQHDFIQIRLGPRTLRTETAAIVACGAMQTLWGDYN